MEGIKPNESTNGEAPNKQLSVENEIVDLNESDSSDLEIIAVSKSIAQKKTKKIKKLQKISTKVYINSAKNLISNDQDSFIKEEIIISDGSISPDEANSHSNFLQRKKRYINYVNMSRKKVRNNESLSSILLNCPRCNITDTVYSVTITSTCKDCNVNMFYVCNQCSFRFKTMSALYRHRKLQCTAKKKKRKTKPQKLYVLRCSSCKFVAKNRDFKHVGKCKFCKVEMKFMCLVCEKSYVSYSGIYKHNQSHCQSDCKPYFCNDCNFNSFNQNVLIAHMKKSHSNQHELDLTCSKCNEAFCDITARKYHEANVCKIEVITCKFCSKRNKDLEDLREHINIFHPEKLQIKTIEVIIQEILNELSARKNSENKVNSSDQDGKLRTKRSYCPHCNIFYNYTHRSRCDTCKTELRFQCSSCSKMFARPSLLVRHTYRQHGKQIYPCTRCGRKFAYRGDLNSHMKRCGQDPSFSCEICYFKTRYKYNMKKHMHRIHNILFFCCVCQGKFGSVESLRLHNCSFTWMNE